MSKLRNGQIGKGEWSHCRWCSVHDQYHAILYNCEKYPLKVQQEIKKDSETFRSNLQDPQWIKQQLDNGTLPEVVAIMKMFAGVDEK